MKPTLKIKIAVDAAMSVSMLLLMAYGLVGEAAHEWIGMGMFALSVAHHVLNRRWIQAVPLVRFLLDYLAVMSLFVLAGYWLARALRPKGQ